MRNLQFQGEKQLSTGWMVLDLVSVKIKKKITACVKVGVLTMASVNDF